MSKNDLMPPQIIPVSLFSFQTVLLTQFPSSYNSNLARGINMCILNIYNEIRSN